MVGRLEAYLVGQINRSDRPNMSISTNLSVTGRWLQYNGKINNIRRPTLEICCTDQKYVFKVPLIGRFMPLVGGINRLLESLLQSVRDWLIFYLVVVDGLFLNSWQSLEIGGENRLV